METIFAQSSGVGKSGVSVFRVSGDNAFKIISTLVMHDVSEYSNRCTYLKDIFTLDGELIDKAIIIFFKSPNSFTGEDVAEIHTHGSIAVSKLLTQSIIDTKLARIANPGEFSKRAVLNGKMDLTMAEGVADLIDAETIAQQKQAIRQMNGELYSFYDSIRLDLLQVIGLVEAYIDFPEEDIPADIMIGIENRISKIINILETHLNDNRNGERLRNGIRLVIFGKPNVGKSSLLNHLSRREVAIVSSIPGTTRDVIETYLDIDGYPIILSDTAGIREFTQDEIEKEGIARAKKEVQNADIKLILIDHLDLINQDKNFIEFFIKESYVQDDSKNVIFAVNKLDLISSGDLNKISDFLNECGINKAVFISTKTHQNIQELLSAIKNISKEITCISEIPAITRIRHRNSINEALGYLRNCSFKKEIVLMAEDIRIAIRSIDHLTGKINVEDILGQIFATFCIGK